MAYSQATANALNQLIAQGLTPEQAFDQLGIPEDDAGFYTVDEVGTPADNPNFGRIESVDSFRVEEPAPQPVPEPPPAAPATQPVEFSPEPVDPDTNPGYGEEDEPFEPDDRVGITGPVDGISPFGEEDDPVDPDTFGPESVTDTGGYPTQTLAEITAGGDTGLTPDQVEAQARAQAEADTKAKLAKAQQQATIQQRYNQTTQGDWRVRIRLMPGANYLYRADPPGILAPLRTTDGVIFPYVPTVQTAYQANYDKYDLTHSNYRGYFYKNSAVGEITVNGVFTAQDTREAEYLLATIHFFRSVTKMFYGKDEFRGAPPPLVELSGFGQFQFNNHPCVVSLFNYTLPNGVDYIRINPNNQGLSLAPRDPLVNSSPNTIQSVVNRLKNSNLSRGAQDLGAINKPAPQTVNGTGQTTYVPTKMEIQITLLPIQTRSQVSQQFSLKDFANGNLLRGGFW
jgi:hypothetical protein